MFLVKLAGKIDRGLTSLAAGNYILIACISCIKRVSLLGNSLCCFSELDVHFSNGCVSTLLRRIRAWFDEFGIFVIGLIH